MGVAAARVTRTAVLLMVTLVVSLGAQSPTPPPASQQGWSVDRIFGLWDRNRDGRLTADEVPTPQLFKTLDRNGDGFVTMEEARTFYARRGAQLPAATGTAQQRPRDLLAQYGNVTPTPHKEEIVEQRPGEPPLKRMPDSDAARDAAGRGQLFESISVKGLTDLQEGMNGVAIVDLNRDGRLDILATYSQRRGAGSQGSGGETLRVFINDGGFGFRTHAIALADSKVTPERFGRGQVPGLADFNNDGFLDLFVTRHAQMTGGRSNPNDQKFGNSLFVSDGAWDRFRDVSSKMGITNEQAYNRQPSFGDVNRDGWIDVAVGCDNIKDAMGGVPHSRLFVFKPNGPAFAGGAFQDVGGTDLVPDFGGFFHDSAKDKAGPDINLRDLDNDGDLDLIQSYDVDVLVALRVIAANHSYKSGGALEAHVGLGARQQVHVRVTLPGQAPVTFTGVGADQFLDLNLETRQSTPVSPKGQP